jgi:nitrate reductase NapD
MNICGILVHAQPGRVSEVEQAASALDGVEVHATTDDGRLIVTIEHEDEAMSGEAVLALHRLPGVVSAAIVYHNFEPEDMNDAQ